ncbi:MULTISPECIES: GNAT family N-acetyltransferase [Vibrio]|uniref:N-acetyltransferase domain-containing protein n=1 Tax=Vibrio lentus TaxID=136468 RepID=A0A2N7BVX6_9VIBR|nr:MULTISPECIES: GNAT family N-acetyltransferase [Vibrio]PME49050.1 hypothetical protein BCV34_14525 [Vibrio lentus]PME64611.1 hypothetical protein BCV30_07495 [Vibrio lentus]PME80237.1 hypothetical protein BCV27_16215 [Vibrio lentus]PMH67650.1 hypothetical protein BCU61_19880 [Vibrio splendidus]PMH90931.1 hypothetical protein BCU56_15460 [Vibrio lentus]
MIIREIERRDWDFILKIQRDSYGFEFEEPRVSLESKVFFSEKTCFVIEMGKVICGYIIALPYPKNSYPALNSIEYEPHKSNNIHIHDLALSPEKRGLGLASILFRFFEKKSKDFNFSSISLVAVNGASEFWNKMNFKKELPLYNMFSYGDNSEYMILSI